jgi:hypothetical protein
VQVPQQVVYLNSNHLMLYWWITRLFGWLFRMPPGLRGMLLRSLEEDINTGRIVRVGSRRSLLPLTLVKETYFLADQLLEFSAFDPQRIHAHWRSQAKRWFADRGLEPETCCFVHVRRGDYIRYPSVEQPGVLPIRFFVEMMERMRAKGFHTFVVASDDWPWVRDALPEVHPHHLLVGQVELTVAVMAQCGAGILSPSTFGWAAALFAGSKRHPERFLAPLHWVGFRQGQWYPYPSLESRTLSYVAWQPSGGEVLGQGG